MFQPTVASPTSSDETVMASSRTPSPRPNLRHSRRTSRSLQRQPTYLAPSISFLPAVIWSEPWQPPLPTFPGLYSLDDLAASVFISATSGETVPTLEVRGNDIAGLAANFKEIIGKAVDHQDFTEVLSTTRSFNVQVFSLYNAYPSDK